MNEYEDEKVLEQLEGIHEVLEVLISSLDKGDCCSKDDDCSEED